MRTIVITGSAGGIGRATHARLEREGHRVIGVDVRDADILADLSTADGRADMVSGVADACGGTLDGLVAAAGIAGHDDEGVVVALNYFGAIATLDGLRPLLARGSNPSAVAISSNSTTTQPALPTEVVAACLAGDEPRAQEIARKHPGSVYPATKLALAHWVRRAAVGDAWIGAGIRLNAVAPGLILTPMTENMADFILNLGDVFPVPMKRAGRPDEVAGLLTYLLSEDATFFCGSVVFMDGGTDAAVRPEDFPTPRP